jgi:hypothetical protein
MPVKIQGLCSHDFAFTARVAEPKRFVYILRSIAKPTEYDVGVGSQVLDGTGKFLMPDLWDLRVHLEQELVAYRSSASSATAATRFVVQCVTRTSRRTIVAAAQRAR